MNRPAEFISRAGLDARAGRAASRRRGPRPARRIPWPGSARTLPLRAPREPRGDPAHRPSADPRRGKRGLPPRQCASSFSSRSPRVTATTLAPTSSPFHPRPTSVGSISPGGSNRNSPTLGNSQASATGPASCPEPSQGSPGCCTRPTCAARGRRGACRSRRKP